MMHKLALLQQAEGKTHAGGRKPVLLWIEVLQHSGSGRRTSMDCGVESEEHVIRPELRLWRQGRRSGRLRDEESEWVYTVGPDDDDPIEEEEEDLAHGMSESQGEDVRTLLTARGTWVYES
jgi:hypothetical protein